MRNKMKDFFYTESIQYETPGATYISYLAKKIYGISRFTNYIFEKLNRTERVESVETLVISFDQNKNLREYTSDFNIFIAVFNETITKTKVVASSLGLDFKATTLDIDKDELTEEVANTISPQIKELIKFVDAELRFKIKR